ncbi:MAG: Uma2 family endonuclease [Selenomonadaceae bacterium]|nr:Uma2 family endonuclease [Selenomonadaceae bacterium]
MDNLAYDYVEDSYDEPDYELIGGEKFIMAAAAPNINHLTITSRLSYMFIHYIEENNINAFVMADADVYLSDKDHYRPDLSIICDLSTVKNGKKVYGVPDLVVEVLSESTMKNDIGKKNDAYEECGVKEYWIVDQWSRRIEVYHLNDKRFILDDVYMASNDDENKDVKNEIKVSIFEDMIVDVRNVFKWWISN